jgi:hypothetical protein
MVEAVQGPTKLTLEEVTKFVKAGLTPPDVRLIDDAPIQDAELSKSVLSRPPKPWESKTIPIATEPISETTSPAQHPAEVIE